MRNFFVSLLFFVCTTATINAAVGTELRREMEAVNQYLRDGMGRARCAGLDLVVSCGNGLCELDKFESLENCPADCRPNVSVRSYNNIILCDEYIATQIPQRVEEVRDIVLLAIAKNQTVKAIGASHSATDIMCAQGVVVAMEKMNQVIGLSTVSGKQVVEVEAGMTVFALSEWLYAKGLALDGLPHMGFRDVTVAGAVATGSHGSTVKHHGVISNIVEAVELVDGQGNIRYLERHSAKADEFKSLTASLGLLGVMTKLKLRVQPAFNLAVKASYHDEYEMFEKGLINQVKDCDYGQINWFPGKSSYMKTCGVKTRKRAQQDANNELLKPKIPEFIVNPFKKVLQMGACYNTLMCMVESVRYLQFKFQPPLVRKVWGKIRNRREVVGPAHRMVSSHLTSNQEGFFQMDWEIAVPASRAQDALVAIKQLVERYNICLPLVGVFIRFAPIDDAALLAHTTATGGDWKKGEPAVFFEMPVYLPLGFTPEQLKAYERPFVEFATMLIRDFSGRPHWGKNRDWAFGLALEHERYGHQIERFKSVMQEYDPVGVFKNAFARRWFGQ